MEVRYFTSGFVGCRTTSKFIGQFYQATSMGFRPRWRWRGNEPATGSLRLPFGRVGLHRLVGLRPSAQANSAGPPCNNHAGRHPPGQRGRRAHRSPNSRAWTSPRRSWRSRTRRPIRKTQEREKELVDSGTVSELDLAAPARAVNEFNHGELSIAGTTFAGSHRPPAKSDCGVSEIRFGSQLPWHGLCGHGRCLAAPKLNSRLPRIWTLSLPPHSSISGDSRFRKTTTPLAGSQLQKAAALRPADPAILTALAYAQNGNHQYRDAIRHCGRVHALQHPGMGNAHYVAAAAAVALNDLPVAQSELALFLQEDPSQSAGTRPHATTSTFSTAASKKPVPPRRSRQSWLRPHRRQIWPIPIG